MVSMTSLFEIFHKQQNQNNLVFQAGMVRNNLVSALNNPVAWKNTTTQSENDFASGVMLDCLNNGKPCTTDQPKDLTAGGTPIGFAGGAPSAGGVLIRQVLDSSGMVILDSRSPNSGYTPQGASCSTFNPVVGSGDDSCPLRYEVHWWAKCNSVANTCVNAQPELQVVAIYNPRKQGHAFNPANYGTPKFLQGQDPGGLCWQLVGTSLYETCADGIGIGTTTPNFPLTLRKDSGANDTHITLADFGAGTNGVLGPMRVGLGVYPSANGAKRYGSIYAGDDSLLRPLILNYNGTTFGSVGIGTTNPSGQLQIGNTTGRFLTFGFSGGAGAPYGMVMASNGYIDQTMDPHMLVKSSSYDLGAAAILLNHDGAIQMQAYNSGAAAPATTAWAPQFTLIPNGSVGIGTTDPNAGLEIAGSPSGLYAFHNWRRGIRLQNASALFWATGAGGKSFSVGQSDSGGSSQFYIGRATSESGGVGTQTYDLTIATNGNIGIGDLTASYPLQVAGNVAAQGFFHTSDKREKTNIVPLGEFESVLKRLDSLHGVYFDWKKSGEKSIGVIAQDVVRDFPELVDRRDERHWTVNYGGLTAVVLEAVKELRELALGSRDKIDALELQNQLLKGEISSLRAEIYALLRVSAKAKKAQND